MYSKASVSVDRVGLQSRIHGQPDVLSPNKPPSLKASRLISRGEGAPLPQRPRPSVLNTRLEPLPALVAHQKRKNEEVMKFDSSTDGSLQPSTKLIKREEVSDLSLPEIRDQPLSSLRLSPQAPLSSRLTESFLLKKKQSTISRRTNQSALYVNTDPGTVITKYYPPLEELSDPLEIIARLKREPELGFLYLTPVGNSSHYNPYNLRYLHIIDRDY